MIAVYFLTGDSTPLKQRTALPISPPTANNGLILHRALPAEKDRPAAQIVHRPDCQFASYLIVTDKHTLTSILEILCW